MNNSRYLSPPPGESKMSVLLYGKLKTSRKKCYELETEMKEYAKMQAWDERVRKEAEKERKLNEMTWKERFN